MKIFSFGYGAVFLTSEALGDLWDDLPAVLSAVGDGPLHAREQTHTCHTAQQVNKWAPPALRKSPRSVHYFQ